MGSAGTLRRSARRFRRSHPGWHRDEFVLPVREHLSGIFTMSGRFRFSFNSLAPMRQEGLTPVEVQPPPSIILPFGDEDAGRPALLDEKVEVHGKIIDEFNLAFLDKMSREDLLRQITGYVSDYVRSQRIPLNQRELEAFTDEILNEMVGLGPIEPLLKDPTVNDIM